MKRIIFSEYPDKNWNFIDLAQEKDVRGMLKDMLNGDVNG